MKKEIIEATEALDALYEDAVRMGNKEKAVGFIEKIIPLNNTQRGYLWKEMRIHELECANDRKTPIGLSPWAPKRKSRFPSVTRRTISKLKESLRTEIWDESGDLIPLSKMLIKENKENKAEATMKCELENTMAAYTDFVSNGTPAGKIGCGALMTASELESGKINGIPVIVYRNPVPESEKKNGGDWSIAKDWKKIHRIDVDKDECAKQGVPVDKITALVGKYRNKKSKAQVLSIYDSKNYKTRVFQNMVSMDSSKTEKYDILTIDVASLADDGWQKRKIYISKANTDDYTLLANGDGYHLGFADSNKNNCFTIGSSWGDQDNFDKVADHLGISADKVSKIVDEVNNNVAHLNCRDNDLLNELKKESSIKVPSMLDKLRSPGTREAQGIQI